MNASEKLKALREQKGMSQADCAKAMNIERTTYAKYENGGSIRRNVEKLAAFFNVSVDYLLGRTDEPGGFQKGLLWDINDDSPLAQKAMEGMSNGWLPMSKTENLEAEKALEWLEKYNKLDINDKNTINSMIDIALRSKEKQSNE